MSFRKSGYRTMNEIRFDSEYITLGQLLKMIGAIDSGGMARPFLQMNTVFVNGEAEDRRGKKLRTGDVVLIPQHGKFKLTGPEA